MRQPQAKLILRKKRKEVLIMKAKTVRIFVDSILRKGTSLIEHYFVGIELAGNNVIKIAPAIKCRETAVEIQKAIADSLLIVGYKMMDNAEGDLPSASLTLSTALSTNFNANNNVRKILQDHEALLGDHHQALDKHGDEINKLKAGLTSLMRQTGQHE